MKLLTRKEAQTSLRKENDELIESNIRLRKSWQEITSRLNNLKNDYEPEKLEKLKEFEAFCKDILARKAKLLEEINALDTEITRRKDLYYGLIAKQDALDEKIYQMNQKEETLNRREVFVTDLENKWRTKTT